MTEELIFRPSGSKRWMSCTASVKKIAELGPQAETTSLPAREGTAGHLVVEHVMVTDGHCHSTDDDHSRVEAEYKALVEEGEWDIDQMIEDAQYMVDLVTYYQSLDKEAVIWAERKVHVPKIHAGIQGTADLIVWLPTLDILVVVDYKYGRIPVSAKANPQLLIYLMGALNELGLKQFPKKMEVVVVQPRDTEKVDSWVVPPYYLINTFMPKLKKAVADVENDPAFFASEDTCTYCPAISKCSEALKMAQEACDFDPDTNSTPIEKLLEMVPVVKAWASAIEEDALTLLKDDVPVPGWELTRGQSRRKWSNEAMVMEYLSKTKRVPLKYIAPRKLLGIPAVEKAITGMKGVDKADLAQYITKPPGKLKLSRCKVEFDELDET